MANPRFDQPGKTRMDLVKQFPGYLKTQLLAEKYVEVMNHFDNGLRTLSAAISAHAADNKIYATPGEANWVLLGADFIVGRDYRPRLLEVNTCPGSTQSELNIAKANTNPYVSALHIMMSHYKRKMVGHPGSDEAGCSWVPALRGIITRLDSP